MSDALSLPPRPNLEQYKKLAKGLQHACKSADPSAIRQWAARSKETIARLQGLKITPQFRNEIGNEAQRVEQRWHDFRKSNDHAGRCTLAGAQLFVARAHGFASWLKFAKHVEALARADTPVSKFEMAVDAIIRGDAARLKSLLHENPELVRGRSTREHHSTLLHYVSANGVEDFRQKTPKNIVEIAKILIDAGAAVNAESDAYAGRSTALGLTATSWHPHNAGVQLALMELLIDHGATTDGPDSGSGVVGCLHNGRREAAEFFASRGARLDLEGAAGIGRLDAVKGFFNEDGTLKPPATEKQMKDGFMSACGYGRTNAVEFLLRRGVGIDAMLKHDGATGLHRAAYGGHLDTVKLLLELGARVDAKDDMYHGTPLDWALYPWLCLTGKVERGRFCEVVAVLARAGAKLDPQQWSDPNQERSHMLDEIDSDPRMQAALRGEIQAE